MNQKVLATLRTIGYIAFFSAFSGLLQYFGTVSWLGGVVAIIATGFGAQWEHQLAAKVGYNLTPAQFQAVRAQGLK